MMVALCHSRVEVRSPRQAPQPTEHDLRRAEELILEGRADARRG